MKTYKIMVACQTANDYIMGRISGIIYALTGMPKSEYTWDRNAEYDWTMKFDATEEQAKTVHKCLGCLYPTTYWGMMCLE